MAVNHRERRREILKKSLVLIAKIGYDAVTFEQIAESVGVGRTTLYKYFKNKRDIFDKGLKMLVEQIGAEFREAVGSHPDWSVIEKIRLIMKQLIDMMFMSPELLQAVVEYLVRLRRSGEPTGKRVRHHTVGFYRVLVRLVREGINNGELRRMDCL